MYSKGKHYQILHWKIYICDETNIINAIFISSRIINYINNKNGKSYGAKGYFNGAIHQNINNTIIKF